MSCGKSVVCRQDLKEGLVSTENLFHAGSDTVPGHCGRQTCINVTMSFLDSLPLIRGALRRPPELGWFIIGVLRLSSKPL